MGRYVKKDPQFHIRGTISEHSILGKKEYPYYLQLLECMDQWGVRRDRKFRKEDFIFFLSLRKHFDINLAADGFINIFQSALQNGNFHCVHLLIQAGVDVHVVDATADGRFTIDGYQKVAEVGGRGADKIIPLHLMLLACGVVPHDSSLRFISPSVRKKAK